jgi:hypothetical protein
MKSRTASVAQRVPHALVEGNGGVWLHTERCRDGLYERVRIACRRKLAQPRPSRNAGKTAPGVVHRFGMLLPTDA